MVDEITDKGTYTIMKSKITNSLAALLACASLLLFPACGGDTPAPAESTSDTVTEAPAPELITVAAKGLKTYSVVRGDEPGAPTVQLAQQFRQKVNKLCGSDVGIKTDFLKRDETPKPDAPEFLVGETNREETARLHEALEAAGGYRFALLTTDCKVAVLGTDEYATYLGLDYFLTTCTVEEDGGKALKIEKNLLYVSDEQTRWTMDFSKGQSTHQGVAFYVGERLVRVPTTGNYGTMQGGGTDGKYAYYAMIDSTTLTSIIYKYDRATWDLVAKSEPIKTAHTNDITYDSKHNRLVISYCDTSDSYKGLCFVDPDTLALTSYFTISTSQRAVEYLPATNQYFLGTNYFFTLTDENFNPISKFNCGSGRYTTQGMCCDDKYIYDVRFISGADVHYIVVHSQNGAYFGECPLYGAPSEPENMFPVGDGEFVLGCNGVDAAYRVRALPSKWWPK